MLSTKTKLSAIITYSWRFTNFYVVLKPWICPVKQFSPQSLGILLIIPNYSFLKIFCLRSLLDPLFFSQSFRVASRLVPEHETPLPTKYYLQAGTTTWVCCVRECWIWQMITCWTEKQENRKTRSLVSNDKLFHMWENVESNDQVGNVLNSRENLWFCTCEVHVFYSKFRCETLKLNFI